MLVGGVGVGVAVGMDGVGGKESVGRGEGWSEECSGGRGGWVLGNVVMNHLIFKHAYADS